MYQWKEDNGYRTATQVFNREFVDEGAGFSHHRTKTGQEPTTLLGSQKAHLNNMPDVGMIGKHPFSSGNELAQSSIIISKLEQELGAAGLGFAITSIPILFPSMPILND